MGCTTGLEYVKMFIIGNINLIFGKKTAQSLKNKALCRSVYIGYTALFFKLKKFF